MISQTQFEEKLEKLCHLCGFVVKKTAHQAYYDSLKHMDGEAVLGGMKLMTKDPPNKLTLNSLLYFIKETKMGETKEIWNGKECSDPDCSMGLTSERIEGNRYVFRCPKCNSTAYRFQDYSKQAVDWIKNKMKNGDLINKESRKN